MCSFFGHATDYRLKGQALSHPIFSLSPCRAVQGCAVAPVPMKKIGTKPLPSLMRKGIL